MYILLTKTKNSSKDINKRIVPNDIKCYKVDSNEEFQSILNFEKTQEFMSFLHRVVKPDTMNITEVKSTLILQAAGIETQPINNTYDLDNILLENSEKVFSLYKNNQVLKTYIDNMFERYYISLKHSVGIPFMGITPNSIMGAINKHYTEYDFDGVKSCYSILNSKLSEDIYNTIAPKINSNDSAIS